MSLRPVWAEISLTNLQHNVAEIRRLVGDKCQIMLPVKADGYGHGALAVSQAGLAAGANALAVSMLDEALSLRQGGIDCPILILGWTPPEAYVELIVYDIATAIYSAEEARLLDKAAARLGKRAQVHIKLDTGMSRLGLLPNQKGLAEAKAILALPHLQVQGIFSHFSKADETDKAYAQKQLTAFLAFVKTLERESGRCIPLKHIANSAAVIDLPQAHLDMVRPGIMLYGQYPSAEVKQGRVDLRPILQLKAKISRVQTFPAETLVSYGGTYRTAKTTTIATVPIGYADGYDRRLSNGGSVLYQGQRLPIIGRICMDQLMIDATGTNMAVGDTVTLIGSDGDLEITVSELAERLDTIVYEISCKLAARIPRIYDIPLPVQPSPQNRQKVRRGEIYYADLEHGVGSEQGGTRPVLIVQNNKGNCNSTTTIAVPITSQEKKKLPTHANISERSGLPEESILLAEQIRAIDKIRLKKRIGAIDEKEMREVVNKLLRISIGLE